MAHSKRKSKPDKPRPDFPLFCHKGSSHWAKKVRGKLHYFGKKVDDPKGEKALEKWLDQKDDLLAGRTPRGKSEGLTIAVLCDKFLQAKDRQLATGEITARHRKNYEATTDKLVQQFGKNRLVEDLVAEDFEKLRATVAEGLGPVSIGNFVQHVRIVFKYGTDSGLIKHVVRFGPMFKRPSKKVLRLARAEKGEKLLTAAEIGDLIRAADDQMSAMIYLGINCGFGNADVGTLPQSALDLNEGWCNYHRPKTGVSRRCPLWPETVIAIKKALAKRPKPKEKADEELVFITKYGAGWAKVTTDNPVTKEFRKLLNELDLHRPGLGFYTLRHTFRTIADESRDQPACNAIMGHTDESMAGVYRERISDERLSAVATHVRQWLSPNSKRRIGKRKAAAAKSKVQKSRAVRRTASRRAASADVPFQFRIVG